MRKGIPDLINYNCVGMLKSYGNYINGTMGLFVLVWITKPKTTPTTTRVWDGRPDYLCPMELQLTLLVWCLVLFCSWLFYH